MQVFTRLLVQLSLSTSHHHTECRTTFEFSSIILQLSPGFAPASYCISLGPILTSPGCCFPDGSYMLRQTPSTMAYFRPRASALTPPPQVQEHALATFHVPSEPQQIHQMTRRRTLPGLNQAKDNWVEPFRQPHWFKATKCFSWEQNRTFHWHIWQLSTSWKLLCTDLLE